MRCPHCQYVKMMAPKTLSSFGFACPNCNNGLSYPEKFMRSLLRELSIDYYYQASNTVFGWCGKIRKQILFGELERTIKKSILKIAADNGFEISGMENR